MKMRLRRRWPRKMRRAFEQLKMQSRRKLQVVLGKMVHEHNVQIMIILIISFQCSEDCA